MLKTIHIDKRNKKETVATSASRIFYLTHFLLLINLTTCAAVQTSVQIFGTHNENGSDVRQVFLWEEGHTNASVDIGSFSKLCYFALHQDASSLFGHQACISNASTTSHLILNWKQDLAKTIHLHLTAFTNENATQDTFALRNQNVSVNISSPFDLTWVHPNLSNEKFSTNIPLMTDDNGDIQIHSTGSLQFYIHTQEVFEDQEITLRLQCETPPEVLGLPLGELESKQMGWQAINENCLEDEHLPGYQHHWPNTSSFYGLITIFDEAETLVGFQLAFPRGLLSASEQRHYSTSQFFRLGHYDGSPAYLLTYYLVDPNDVCNSRLQGCRGHQPFLMTNTGSKVALYPRLQDALDNGWREADSNGDGFSLQPSEGDAPCLIEYTNGSWSGLTSIFPTHGIEDKSLSLKTSIFQPHDGDSRTELRTSFYLGRRPRPRTSATNHEHLFHLKIKDSDGDPVEGATIKLHSKHDVKAGQLVTNRRGHAFVAFNHHVEDISFDVLVPQNSGNRVWKVSNPYHLARSSHRQSVTLKRLYKRTVHVKVDDGLQDPQLLIWTNKRGHRKWSKHYSSIQVDWDVNEIHVLQHDSNRVIYRSFMLDTQDTEISLHFEQSHHQSTLTVVETQSQEQIEKANVDVHIGLPHIEAIRLDFKAPRVHFDVPKGLLVSWTARGEKGSHNIPQESSSITPFHTRTHLLKTVDIHVHVCLFDSDESGADKEAEVEAVLEYEWATQDDHREIFPLDYEGNLQLNNVPSPKPGESLNVTLISRLGSNRFYSKFYHRLLAQESKSIQHDAKGPIQLKLCHAQETVAVVVSNAITGWRMNNVQVSLRPLHDERQTVSTDDEGVALFSFEAGGPTKFDVQVASENFDHVHLSKYTHSSLQTQVVHVQLWPQKKIRIEVNLESRHYHQPAAAGALIDWNSEHSEGGLESTNGQGQSHLILCGRCEQLHQLTAFLPWQSTCGGANKNFVYGMTKVRGKSFPLSQRPPFHADIVLTLPRLDKVFYALNLEGHFPDVAKLHHSTSVDVLHRIRHDHANFYVPVGIEQALLHLVEFYTSSVIVSHIRNCFDVDESILNEEGKALEQTFGVLKNTVKVTVWMVDNDFRRVHNVTLSYAVTLLPTSIEGQVEADFEDAQVVFHVPEDVVVLISAQSFGLQPNENNPDYFKARDGLEIYLVFGHSHLKHVTVGLIGDGFQVPEGTVLKYVARDGNGESEHQAIVATDPWGETGLTVTANTAYIDFDVGGSDGFDPIFFQPFEYIYNVSDVRHLSRIDIRVRSWKNVIVAVRDCLTGELLPKRSLVKFPQEAVVWRQGASSWSYTDDQGLAFFQLEPDWFIPVQVESHGYEDFSTRISVSSNVTHFVQADICRQLTVNMKVLADDGRAVSHATIEVTLDNKGHSTVTTDNHGRATFEVSTGLRVLSLQLVDGDDSVKEAIFELQDDENFLKEGDVRIVIRKRQHTIELATVSCPHFKNFPHVSVLLKIDENGEFIRTSDRHGSILLRVDQEAEQITATVLHHEHKDHVISIVPVEKVPKHVRFQAISYPVVLSLQLVDGYFSNRPVAHATIGVKLEFHDYQELTTNDAGEIELQVSTIQNAKTMTVQILDARKDVVSPHFHLRDDCSEALNSHHISLHVLERMHTMHLATGSCQTFEHQAQVPVLIQFSPKDRPQNHANIHQLSKAKWIFPRDDEFVIYSNHKGLVQLRLPESAANVTATILGPPQAYKGQVSNLGFLVQDDLPEDLTFHFHGLPKAISVTVHDSETGLAVIGAHVKLTFYDTNEDRIKAITSRTDDKGRASLELDGCVEFASFYVSADHYSAETRHHWNILEHHRFTIALKPKDLDLTIDTDGVSFEQMVFTKGSTTHELDSSNNQWKLKAHPKDYRVHLLAASSHIAAFRSVELVGLHDGQRVSLLEDLIKIEVRVQDHQEAQITWHLGFGLDKATVRTSRKTDVAVIYAPKGLLLVLEAHHCPSKAIFHVQDKHMALTLACD